MFRESSPVSRQSYFRECPALKRSKVAKAGLATEMNIILLQHVKEHHRSLLQLAMMQR